MPAGSRLALLLLLAVAGPIPAAHADPADPTLAILQRIDGFLHRGEGPDGVTRDPRNLRNPPEEIRLSVVPQLLGYCELYRVFPHTTAYRDIVDRADFLLAHEREATSGSAFDGMLALGFLEAHAITGDPRYRRAAEPLLARFRAMQGGDLRLNWGLMAGMALAEDARATGNPGSLEKVHQILQAVRADQNLDGSFPHYCYRSRDIHYSAWMAMEMILIGERVDDPALAPLLSGVNGFLGGRVDLAGLTRYQEAGPLGVARSYYSLGTGCPDYDTRGWTNELGYTAMLFDHFQDPRFQGVTERLRQLQDGGAFPDKWDYMPDPLDPIYPWAAASHSVIRTSIVFWSLASLYAARQSHVPVRYEAAAASGAPDEVADATSGGEGISASVPPDPRPSDPAAPADEDLAPYVSREAPAVVESDAVSGETAAGLRAGEAAEAGRATQSLPLSFALGPVSPNPGSGSCSFALRLPRAAELRLRIYDGMGRLVRDLSGSLPAGSSLVRWDGRDVAGREAPAGLYWLEARAPGWRSRIHFVILR